MTRFRETKEKDTVDGMDQGKVLSGPELSDLVDES